MQATEGGSLRARLSLVLLVADSLALVLLGVRALRARRGERPTAPLPPEAWPATHPRMGLGLD